MGFLAISYWSWGSKRSLKSCGDCCGHQNKGPHTLHKIMKTVPTLSHASLRINLQVCSMCQSHWDCTTTAPNAPVPSPMLCSRLVYEWPAWRSPFWYAGRGSWSCSTSPNTWVDFTPWEAIRYKELLFFYFKYILLLLLLRILLKQVVVSSSLLSHFFWKHHN